MDAIKTELQARCIALLGGDVHVCVCWDDLTLEVRDTSATYTEREPVYIDDDDLRAIVERALGVHSAIATGALDEDGHMIRIIASRI